MLPACGWWSGLGVEIIASLPLGASQQPALLPAEQQTACLPGFITTIPLFPLQKAGEQGAQKLGALPTSTSLASSAITWACSAFTPKLPSDTGELLFSEWTFISTPECATQNMYSDRGPCPGVGLTI